MHNCGGSTCGNLHLGHWKFTIPDGTFSIRLHPAHCTWHGVGADEADALVGDEQPGRRPGLLGREEEPVRRVGEDVFDDAVASPGQQPGRFRLVDQVGGGRLRRREGEGLAFGSGPRRDGGERGRHQRRRLAGTLRGQREGRLAVRRDADLAADGIGDVRVQDHRLRGIERLHHDRKDDFAGVAEGIEALFGNACRRGEGDGRGGCILRPVEREDRGNAGLSRHFPIGVGARRHRDGHARFVMSVIEAGGGKQPHRRRGFVGTLWRALGREGTRPDAGNTHRCPKRGVRKKGVSGLEGFLLRCHNEHGYR